MLMVEYIDMYVHTFTSRKPKFWFHLKSKSVQYGQKTDYIIMIQSLVDTILTTSSVSRPTLSQETDRPVYITIYTY